MLRHHTACEPVRPRLHVSGFAPSAVGMVSHARHPLITAEPLYQSGRLEHGMVTAAVAPAPDVETLSGHVAEGRWTMVRSAAHEVTIRRLELPR